MIDERQDERAALFAFDLLEGSEKRDFVEEWERNAELRARVAELRLTASALAHAAPAAPPPAGLRARILESAAASVVAPPHAGTGGRASARVVAFPTWIAWLAAACLAVGILWTGYRYEGVRTENESLRQAERVAASTLDQLRGQLSDSQRQLEQSGRQIAELNANLKAEGDLARFKIATLASMLGNSPSALAVAVWDPTREEGVLAVSKLPALASEKDYQLWVIDPRYPAPVSGGVFEVDPATGQAHIVFKAGKPVRFPAKFAVSLERKGGAPEPEGPIVLMSD